MRSVLTEIYRSSSSLGWPQKSRHQWHFKWIRNRDRLLCKHIKLGGFGRSTQAFTRVFDRFCSDTWCELLSFHLLKILLIVFRWDPLVDIVDFLDMKNHALQIERFLQLFIAQFPLQASQVQCLAISSCLWETTNHDVVSRIWPLVDCHNLKELIVDVDHDYEKRVVRYVWGRLQVDRHMARSWTLPQDVDKLIVVLKEHHSKWAPKALHETWKPLVRICWDKHDTFKSVINSDSGIALRCHPCPTLGIDWKMTASEAYGHSSVRVGYLGNN